MGIKLFLTTLTLALLGTGSVLPDAQAMPNVNLRLAQQFEEALIDDFNVVPVDSLRPGTELVFTLQGTPRARASVTISNVVTNLPLQEIEPGIYEGRYTIRSRDRFTDTTVVRANLQKGDRISSVRLQEPLVSTGTSFPNNPNNPNNPNSVNSGLYIDRFNTTSVNVLEPGNELEFTLVGTPNARASFSIEGVTVNQPMQEVSPGTYQGEYVIRRQDYFPTAGVEVVATLQSGNQSVRSRLVPKLGSSGSLNNPLNTTQLPLEVISPQNNSRVQGTVEVRGRSTPNATIQAKVQATTSLAGLVGVNQNILTRTLQTDAQGNFSFSFRPAVIVSGTRYEVNLTATQGDRTNQTTLVLIQE